MDFVCVEPVINAAGVTAFTSFMEDGTFSIHHITEADSSTTSYFLNSEKFEYFCFDVFKTFNTFGDQIPFLWDVKILYELLGHKTETLIALGTEIFSAGRMQKYVGLSTQVKAHLNSYRQAGIDAGAYDTLKLLPQDLIYDLYLERAEIIKDLFLRLTVDEKSFYVSFYKSVEVLRDISKESLNIDLEAIEDDISVQAQAVRRSIRQGKTRVQFNAVGAKTGRLGLRKNSLNIYNMPRHLRKCILPSPGHTLVEVDFKSFQPRLAIALTDNDEFIDRFREVDDIYSVFPGDRSKNKIAFLAWMYAKRKVGHQIFDEHAAPVWELRNALAKRGREQGVLETRWGRRLYFSEGDPKHVIFQNYVTATEVDCILQLTQKLVGMGIKVLFPYHDAVVCEVANEDLHVIQQIREQSEKLLYDLFSVRFPVGVNTGNNYGNMNAISVESVQKS
jgi:hypothetical protein